MVDLKHLVNFFRFDWNINVHESRHLENFLHGSGFINLLLVLEPLKNEVDLTT